jgi:hypothetical protein
MTFHITFFILLFACMACIVALNEHLDQREWEGARFTKPIRVIGIIAISGFWLWFFCLIGDRV